MILISFVSIAGIAILLESAPASVVRIIAISFCILLLSSMAAGLWARSRAKKRQAREMAEEWLARIEADDQPGHGEAAQTGREPRGSR